MEITHRRLLCSTLWRRVFENLVVTHLLKNCPAFHGIGSHYHVHKGPLLVSILSQEDPVRNFAPYFPKIRFNIIFNLCLKLPNGLFSSRFRTEMLYAFLISHIRATCLIHLILLDFTTLMVFGAPRPRSPTKCLYM
jgi:hypothetical protein